MAPSTKSAPSSPKAPASPSYMQPTEASKNRAKRVQFASPMVESKVITPITKSKVTKASTPAKKKAAGAAAVAPGLAAVSEKDVLRQREEQGTRSGFGDRHASKESAMMAAHAQHLREAGKVDAEMGEKLAKPWHASGVLDIQYSNAYHAKLNPNYLAEAPEIMDFEKARRIAAKKDEKEKKFLERYFGGEIDANGNAIAHENSSAAAAAVADEDEDEDEEEASKSPSSPPVASAAAASTVKKAPKAAQVPGIQQGKVEKKKAKKTTTTKSSPSSTSTTTTNTNTSSSSSSGNSTTSSNTAPITPLPGRPSYADLTYYDLAALCRERRLPSKGNTVAVRNRLIQDDINVVQGLPRERKKYTDKRKHYKHAAPVVEGVPEEKEEEGVSGVKRGRSVEEGEEEGGEKKKMKKGGE